MTDQTPEWLIAFRSWAVSENAPQFPSRHEEMEAESAFRAGYDALRAELLRLQDENAQLKEELEEWRTGTHR